MESLIGLFWSKKDETNKSSEDVEDTEQIKREVNNNPLRKEFDKVKDKNRELKQSFQEQRNVISNLQQKIDGLEREKRESEPKLKSLKEKIESNKKLEKDKKDYEKRLGREKEKVQKLENELSKEGQKTKILIEQNKHYEKQLEKKSQEFNEILEAAKDYQQKLNQLKERHSELESAKENMRIDMENNINNLEQQLKDQRKTFQQNLEQVKEKHKKNIEVIKQEKGNGLRELEIENAKLKDEASKYQSALGVATNTRIGDGDQNHSVKLKQDISKLQNTLDNYVTHLKPNMNINIEEVQKLAQEYGCLNEINAEKPNKLFVKAILQRKVLDVVCKFSQELFEYKYQGETFALESDIDTKAQELSRLIDTFSATRVGIDEVTNASIVKIRQQTYGILGNRGFNDIIDNDGSVRTHDFIKHVSDKLNEMMNQYRKINDLDRKKQVEAMAPKLIQDIYKLFWFRINVQEPILECKFFKGDKIDPDMMKGSWYDDEIDQICVDICFFPLIGRNLDSPDAKIYTSAKVFPRRINETDE